MSEVFYKRNLAVPFFTQRDNTYVWQQISTEDKKDDDGVYVKQKNKPFGPKYPMAWRTCNITSLCMILHYFHITTETPNQMIENVYERTDWGWLYEADSEEFTGPSRLENWDNLTKVAQLYLENNKDYTVTRGTKLSIEILQQEIAKGFPIVISTGLGSIFGSNKNDKGELLNDGYEQNGHIVVVRGFTDEGDVILNDPYGIPVEINNNIRHEGTSDNINGFYYLSTAAGIGDNIIINIDDFIKVYAKDTSRYLYIEGPLWNLPGGVETDKENCFPIKSSNYWHNGIHLQSSSGFNSIGCGRLIAARNSEIQNHGSKSFALVKYQLPNNNNYFYALYMHLNKIDLKQELNDFFLINEGKLNNKLQNTWIEQIFNNILPRHKIWFYSGETVTQGEKETIYEAKIQNGRIIKTNKKIKFGTSEYTGIESKHMKVYLLPPDRISFIADIDNYKNVNSLSFMVNKSETDFIKKESDGNSYYYFFCGKGIDRKLCCAIAGEQFSNSYDIYNEASYKYYVNKLYQLYDEKTVIFNKNDNTQKTKITVNSNCDELIDNSLFTRKIVFNESGRFKIALQNTRGIDSILIEHIYQSLLATIQLLQNKIEKIFVMYAETGYSAGKTNLDKLMTGNNGYIKRRINQIENCLAKIEKEINNKQVQIIEGNTESGITWMIKLFQEAEEIINCKELIYKQGNYDSTMTYGAIRKIFFDILDEYSKVNILPCIAICEFLLLEFISIPKDKINSNDRYTTSDNTIKDLKDKLSEYLHKLYDSYKLFFQKRYIDNFIEIPKEVKIGEGSNIPDSNKNNSIHFEIFSTDKLIESEIEIKDEDNDKFYNVPEITKLLLESLQLSEEEKNKYIKFADDNILTSNEIIQLYTQTDLFKKSVVFHKSEWNIEKYTSDIITNISSTKRKVKNEVMDTIDFMNDYYAEYNWVNSEIEKAIGGDKFYFYHPLYLIEKLIEEDKK